MSVLLTDWSDHWLGLSFTCNILCVVKLEQWTTVCQVPEIHFNASASFGLCRLCHVHTNIHTNYLCMYNNVQ